MGVTLSVEQAARRYGPWVRTRAKVLRPALTTHTFTTERPSRGRALVSYLTEAFERGQGDFRRNHANLWECREIVRTFLDLGFDVDVINFRNFLYTPRRPYDFLLDPRHNLERLGPQLGDACTKVHLIETSHMLFQNAAEYARLRALQQRRGVTLQPRRVERRMNLAIEHADLSILYGGEHSARTWAYAGRPMFQVPGTPLRSFPSPAGRDVEAIRRNYLFVGSGGLVLKGLDLVLEAFAGMPDHNLTVCGPIADEPDFAAAYHRELFETPNITTLGWVDVHGPVFAELMRSTIGLVYPSASESLSGVVVNSLHAGVIPVVTPECGVAITPDMGTVLTEVSVEAIRSAVRSLSARAAEELEAMALCGWAFARSTHTRERFSAAYRAILEGLIGDAEMPVPYAPSAPPAPDGRDRRLPA